MHLPAWLTWGTALPVLSGLPGWIALALAVKKMRQEKTSLEFMLGATTVVADEGDGSNMFMDGTPIIRALSVTVTNVGQRPVTILDVKCRWSFATTDDEPREAESRAWVNKKLGQGDHLFAYPKFYKRPLSVISVWAKDSTGQEWPVPTAKVDELNFNRPKQWH